MGDYMHFSRDPSPWEESTQMLWGSHDICPSLSWFKVRDVTQWELLAFSSAGVWEDAEKPQCNMAYLLIVPGKTIEGEMAFRLTMVWAHPHQAHLLSLDELARKHALLIDIGDNWAYAFVWLNEVALHVPLSSEGNISAMINGVPSRSTCRHLYQLQVWRILHYGSHVVCPEGLNGGLEPVQLSIPQLPMWDMNIFCRPVHECLQLQVNLPRAMLSDKMPFFQFPAKSQCHPPPHVWLQRVLVKWLTTPTWLPGLKNSCLRWCWTPPAWPQGTAPQEWRKWRGNLLRRKGGIVSLFWLPAEWHCRSVL